MSTSPRSAPRPPPSRSPRKGLCGLGDLVRVFAEDGEIALDIAAGLIGYVTSAEATAPTRLERTEPTATSGTPPVHPIEDGPLPNIVFQYPVARTEFDAALPTPLPARSTSPAARWASPPARKSEPLTPWSVLLPRLRVGLAKRRPGQEIDLLRLTRWIGSGDAIDRLPRLRQRRWGAAIQIITDCSRRLTPFMADQQGVIKTICRLYASGTVSFAAWREGDAEPICLDRRLLPTAYAMPPEGSAVLVLGDLGCLMPSPPQRVPEAVTRWQQFGERLVLGGCRPIALSPCPPGRWYRDALPSWTQLAWEEVPDHRCHGDQELARRLDALLTLVSPAMRVEPGLLRDLRRLLGPAADAGTEADFWMYRRLGCWSCVAAELNVDASEEFRRKLAELPADLEARARHAALQEKVQRRIEAWRGGDKPREFFFEEVLNLGPEQLAMIAPETRAAAVEFFQRIAPQLRDLDRAREWYREVYRYRFREHFDRNLGPELSAALYAASFDREEANLPQPPAGFDPRYWASESAPKRWTLCQRGGELFADAQLLTALAGSPLTTIVSRNRELIVESIPFWKDGNPPAFADAWGSDDFGLWVEFSVAGEDDAPVTQRLRWIRPGRFLMGSYQSEPGRFENEGPQHLVTISHGFWLFDSPCTQALWQAVMGKNPSEFKSPDRPVESVSWDDCRAFIERLNARVAGLELCLPSEAQWEYACRAGSEMTSYPGPLEILGENNAPGLDPIATYGGNSGVDFDLDDGYDSSRWREKQYKHTKAGTRRTKRKNPNGWGLYDMLGNVLEWCVDGTGKYGPAAVTDPISPFEGSSKRVLRGGSWYFGARFVRPACRFWRDAGIRHHDTGFRCARGQDGAEPAGGWRGRDAERRTADPRPGGAGTRALQAGGPAVPWPGPGPFIIRSDCEQVSFAPLVKPDWASAIGRDRFGLWAAFEVGDGPAEPISQRMRWIPPGRFRMGSPQTEAKRISNEGPQHSVTLTRGFWLFDTACSQALWQAVMAKNPSRFRDNTGLPVENVTWDECQVFLERLNGRIPKLDLVLPSEAQWEYACRAGTNTPFSFDATISPDQVNCDWKFPYTGSAKGEVRRGTVPVGSLPPNSFGLFEMHGNVWEWCADGLRKYGPAAVTDPVGSLESGSRRVLRGGSWYYDSGYVRSASRRWNAPGYRYDNFGFRCARGQD